MLHVFNVNRGKMMTFEVNLAMERVLELKSAIAETNGISTEKQVMLISNGKALCDDERVCSYAAGTETNPVYLFDKACIEKEMLQMESSYQEGSDFVESIRNARTLAPSYKTVDIRTQIAMRLHNATRQQVQHMKSLVHDEHLMFQGWQAAVSNLSETLAGFQRRVEAMCAQCQMLFEQAKKKGTVLEGMDSVLKSLEQIPILPALLKTGLSGSFSSNSENFQVSLLHWIKAQCKNVSVQSMFNECKQKQEYLSQEHYMSLMEECQKVESQAANTKMSEISGINERLAALDNLIVAAEQQEKEQTGIAQGFVRNRETARELQNNKSSIDALLTLCESHVTQLQIMSEYETMTRDALHKCTHAKHELAANLHQRLRWLYFVQRSLLNADVKLSMFVQQLSLLHRQIEFLDQVKQCPTLYLSALVEVVRRRNFANAYVQWANKAVADARVERDREIVKRKTFHSNIAGHFIQKLFHGLSDKPPSLSKKPLRTFDNNLPDITPEQLLSLSQLLPNFKDLLDVSSSESSGITSMTLTHSSSFPSPTASTNVQSTQNMDASVGSPPEVRSMGTSTKHSPTGSFAMVDPAAIAQTQPGGFVVTSVENVKQANLEGNAAESGDAELEDESTLPRRVNSTTTLTDEQHISPASSPDRTDSVTVFDQIGDIISPDSPPDSEFFSIMPGSFASGRSAQDRLSMDRQISVPAGSLSPSNFSGSFSPPEVKRRNSPTSPRKQSMVKVGSLESNSSTSYQKVDGLSSDEEMFHSFTSEQQDVKILRKKLHQVQSEYDNLLESVKMEKEDLNTLIRKLQQENSSMKENQTIVESEFEKRWSESKSELDNLVKQLENERSERKKAWTEGAALEKKLKSVEEEFHSCAAQMENLQSELNSKTEAIQLLENNLTECQASAASSLAEAEQRLVHLEKEKESTSSLYKSVSTKMEKQLSFAQVELATAEDRIQELETMLSDHERRQQEDAVRFQEFEAKLNDLNRELSITHESCQKSSNETAKAQSKHAETEQKLQKSNEQIVSLKKLLADYEIKLEDDKNKDNLMKNMKASMHQLELDKAELESGINSCKTEIENLKNALMKSENEIESVKSLAIQDTNSHKEEMEKLEYRYQQEVESITNKYREELRSLNEKQEMQLHEMAHDNANVLQKKDHEWKLKEEEIRSLYRNELDELEADRLACVASSQQSIEDLREKLRESSRILEQERKDSASLKDSMVENNRRMEEEYARILQENENLTSLKSEVEDRLVKAEEEIRNLQEREKQDAAAAKPILESSLTSSTDEEMECKRSKIDFEASEMVLSTPHSSLEGRGSMPIEEHKRTIGIMRKNFEEDKKSLKNLYKRKEEEAAKRRQMIFNSAIQRVTTSKDQEIKTLREKLMAQSQMTSASVSQSMMVTPPQAMTVSLTQPPISMPSPPSFSAIEKQPSARSNSPLEPLSGRAVDSSRDKDRAAVANFKVGDTVLVRYNETYQHFILLSTTRTLYFVHHESLENLGISESSPDAKNKMVFATLVDKEYCQARKSQNRFKVPINTKFFRVRVAPLSKKEAHA